ncbi:MAG: cytochrome c biogenesis protein DipZ [Candidatus Levybacteria bacterium]|nr:cytochrome c biogenesis protein DipZ [Candidatus Levybacteria bacterium]
MVLLILFSFFAGVVTILSPCILPLLPIILSSTIGGEQTGKSRPIGVIAGFILSFTFFTLFLATIVRVSGIPADTLRFLSVVIIAAFGISFLIPQAQAMLERLFSSLSRLMPQGNTQSGFGPGLLVGFSLGLLWTPCVGPILASVISLAITETVTANAFFITLAYAIGTAIPMLAIMIGGQKLLRKVPWLLNNSAKVQKTFGIIMILTALAIYFNLDRKFQTFIITTFPNYGAGLTQFEDIPFIRNQLRNLDGKEIKKEDMGKPMFDLTRPKGKKAPELIPGGVWFNSDPLTLAQLKGKVVLIDFWTYSCINCQRTLPYLRSWWEKYNNKGLVIIGVHSPEFAFEREEKNVKAAISDFGLKYPIVQDNNFDTWMAYDNHYWPAKYLIDKDGYIRYSHFGEGKYDDTEKVIQELLAEMGTDIAIPINNPSYQVYSKTPETYLGYGRIENFASPEIISPNKLSLYSSPKTLPDNGVAFEGNWIVMEEYANPQKGAKLFLNFESKEVFLVMRTSASPAKVKVYVDDKLQYFGEDNKNGTVTVGSDRLYKLINLPSPGQHILRLEFEDSDVQLFAFTFG